MRRSGAKDNKCKKKCPPSEKVDIPQICLIEKPMRSCLRTGCIQLPRVCECPKPCEYVQRPRILVDTNFIKPCTEDVELIAPKGRPRPGECVEVPEPKIKMKPCPATKLRYKRTDLNLCKPCPQVAPVNVRDDKCTLELPRVTVRDIDCHVELDTEPFTVPCVKVKCKDVDVALPKITSKPEIMCIEVPKFCPPEPPADCPPQHVPC